MRLIDFSFVLIATVMGARAAMAFNCEGISLPSSIVICSDSDLMRLADERQQIYNETRARLSPEQRATLLQNQNAWVHSYATACGVPPGNPPPMPVPASVIECFKHAAEARAAYLRTFGTSGGAASASVGQPAAAPLQPQRSDAEEVALVPNGQLFEIPVQINGVITLPFIIDSGASDVQITADVFLTLTRTKTIVPADVVGERTYVLADGSEHKAPRFLIRELKVGDRVLRNVAASVGSPAGQLLLGQSFLSHFDSWTLDNKRHVLALVGKPAGSSDETAPIASSPAQTSPIAALTAPPPLRGLQAPAQTAMVCGRPVEFAIEQGSTMAGLLGVWTGNWNNAGRLCGGLIVERIDPDGTAGVIYVYGPSRPGSGLQWRQQHQAAAIANGVLSFRDEQGSTFRFSPSGPGSLDASFISQTGRLTGVFAKSQ